MKFEQMPQGQDNVIRHRDENNDFDNLVNERCQGSACSIINEDKFVHELLFDLKNHDQKTFLHSLEVGNMASFLIEKLGNKLTEKERQILMSAALLHDYGKTSISPEILNKKDILTPEERKEIEKHPTEGFYALREWNIEVAKVAVAHHEHQEHSYPRKNFIKDFIDNRKKDEKSDKISRILAIIDSFQAMIDPSRPSTARNPKSIDEIISELNNKFILNEDKEIIFLLEEYYYKKNNL